MILDGWGIGNHSHADVIYNTPTPYWDYLLKTYPHSQLQASGENVGLPDGQMGNSEVGHLNIGAGRIVYQDLVKINKACADNSILQNKEIVSAFSYARDNGKNIHFMGLTSNGGVHSSLDHLFKLCDIAKEYGLENTFIHCFMDGRDTDPHSGKGFLADLQAKLDELEALLGKYVPGAEALRTKLKKYDAAYKTLTAENAALEKQLGAASKESVLKKLEINEKLRELDELHRMVDGIPPEILQAAKQVAAHKPQER